MTDKPMTKLEKHLSIPENRIGYAYHFLNDHSEDFIDRKKCYDALATWIAKCDTSEAHY